MKSTITRRDFMEKTAVVSGLVGLSGLAQAKESALPPYRTGAGNELYSDLLTRWCDALVSHQISEIKAPGIYGGIMCPLCSRVHGRSSDAIHPLMRMAHTTGQSKYLDAAIKLQGWSNHVGRNDGSWINEPIGNEWKGTTVVGVLALAACLKHHGDLLDTKTRQAWTERLAKGAVWVRDFIHINTGKINYPVSATAALMAADQILDDASLRKKAHDLAHSILGYFTQEHTLLFGEGNPHEGYTPMGCRPVDLGYNIEESLPNFALYAKISQDKEVTERLVQALRAHMEFMLPDGAWDNSWGTRNFKWTYWGTRTGDGCQAAYALMAQHDPRFATVALRNAELLDRCTHDGILYGGPHYTQQGELPCIHHTFCHARGFATVLDNGVPPVKASAALPREKAQGVQEYKEIRTWLAGIGPWRATVTAYDWIYDEVILPAGHASGGALSALWHQQLGPVMMASVTEYGLQEPSNMQPVREPPLLPATPRVELITADATYSNLYDLKAQIAQKANAKHIDFAVQGELKERKQNTSAGLFKLDYQLTGKTAMVRAETQLVEAKQADGIARARLVLPVICSIDDKVTRIDQGIEITKSGGRMRITWNSPEAGVDLNKRLFHPTPGFQLLPLAWELAKTGGTPVQVLFEFV